MNNTRSKISVCIATYNGEKYIKEQLDSILSQLHIGDEVIIVDDKSKDNTVNIIKSYNSPFITLYHNDINIGHVKSFSKALSFSNNEYIVFSDQDDVWKEGRLELLYSTIVEKEVFLVSSNYEILNESGNKKKFLKLVSEDSQNNIKNIKNIFLGKAPYYGCTMIINSQFKKNILPIPTYIEAHDLWMAMAANILKSNYHLDKETLYYRIHGNNTSLKKRTLSNKIKTRFCFLKGLFKLILEKNKN